MFKLVLISQNEFTQFWHELCKFDFIKYASYSDLNYQYSNDYFGDIFDDKSVIVIKENIPIAGIRLTGQVDGDTYKFSCYGRPILYIENTSIPIGIVEKAQSLLKEYLTQLSKDDSFKFKEFHYRERSPAITFLGQYLLNEGARTSIYFSQQINLNLSTEDLWRDLRKSFKHCTNWGKEKLETKIIDNQTIKGNEIEEMRELHIRVVGKETRSKSSWDLQKEMVHNNEAFLVSSYFNHELVSASFFNISEFHALYSVSVSRRDLFDKPLNHIGIWKAVEYAKEKNIKVLEFNDINFKGTTSDEKLVSISSFKRGFGGNLRYDLDLNLKLET